MASWEIWSFLTCWLWLAFSLLSTQSASLLFLVFVELGIYFHKILKKWEELRAFYQKQQLVMDIERFTLFSLFFSFSFFFFPQGINWLVPAKKKAFPSSLASSNVYFLFIFVDWNTDARICRNIYENIGKWLWCCS